jgi:PIN domain nuclease of toxin-antitoxin system
LLDTSALLAHYLAEPGAERVQALLAQLSQLDHGFVNFSRSTLAICSETRGFFPARSL